MFGGSILGTKVLLVAVNLWPRVRSSLLRASKVTASLKVWPKPSIIDFFVRGASVS